MNSYEIEIYNIKDDSEMNKIQHALYEAGITDAGEEETGMYLHYGSPRSVFVGLDNINSAVKVLNDLGYETDEDEAE